MQFYSHRWMLHTYVCLYVCKQENLGEHVQFIANEFCQMTEAKCYKIDFTTVDVMAQRQ